MENEAVTGCSLIHTHIHTHPNLTDVHQPPQKVLDWRSSDIFFCFEASKKKSLTSPSLPPLPALPTFSFNAAEASWKG